jgi:anti-anti-sigma factor
VQASRQEPHVRYKRRIGPGELEIRDDALGARHILRLRGELDIAGAPRLDAEIVRLCAEGASEVLLDLSELEFLDSTGFRTILAVREHCEAQGCAFRMTRPTEPVHRVFALSGLLRKLPFA